MNICFKLVIVTTYRSMVFAKCMSLIKLCNKMESGCMKLLLTMPRTFFQVGKLWKGTSGYSLCFWEGLINLISPLNGLKNNTYIILRFYLFLLFFENFMYVLIIVILPYQLFSDPSFFPTNLLYFPFSSLRRDFSAQILWGVSFYDSMLI